MAERKAKRITEEQFRDLILKKTKETDFDTALHKLVSKKVEKDLSKVTFDMENCTYKTGYFGNNSELGFKTINGLTILLFCAGGDWEIPLVFALYVDPSNNIRGYIPSDGNVYNHKLKCAYGSEQCTEDFDEDEEIDYENIDDIFDNEAMIADICARIIVVD